MIKYLILMSILLTGCLKSDPFKATIYTCFTPMGPARFQDNETTKVYVRGGRLYVSDDTGELSVDMASCVTQRPT